MMFNTVPHNSRLVGPQHPILLITATLACDSVVFRPKGTKNIDHHLTSYVHHAFGV